jgi:hypothetical protein
MKRFFTIAAVAVAAVFMGWSIAQADPVSSAWIVQQQIAQQQAQQALAAELARQQIQQATQRQIDTQNLSLQTRGAALEAQRSLNALQLRYELDSGIQNLHLIQQQQLLQILQFEVNPAPHKKPAAHKRPAAKP